MPNIEEMKPYATDRQYEVLTMIHKCNGSYREAGRALGIDVGAVSRIMKRLRNAAARQGYAPEYDLTHPVPQGFKAETSTLYDEEGNVRLQWVKSSADKKEMEAMLAEAMDAFCSELPKAKPVKKIPAHLDSELLNLYIVTDYHLGMKSWHEETGEDWDLQIAEDLIYAWFDHAIKHSPNSENGILAQLGDFTHFDTLEAVTPTNRHQLDADTRIQKIVRIAIRIYRRLIDRLLTKHNHVYVIVADANHDPMGSIWAREWLEAHYDNEPRVTVDLGADGYYAYEHGQTSLFFHHGHKRKPANIDDVFVAKYRDLFGRTQYSYGHMGHLHHIESKETNLMLIEQHRTMAAKDAYASRGGYMAGRDAKVITYHKEYGEVGRLTVTPEMISEGSSGETEKGKTTTGTTRSAGQRKRVRAKGKPSSQ